MDLTRSQHLTILTMSTLILIHVHYARTNLTQWVDTLASFPLDPEAWWIYKVVVDKDDNVYVAGTNVLFHLSPDLELKETLTTGPVMDHPDCMHPSYPCSTKKVSTDNFINVLELVYNLGSRPHLLLCGTVYRMLCQIRPVDNLTDYHWVHPFNQSVGYSASVRSTFSYFGPGYEDQQTLITVASVDSDYQGNHFAPFISSKVIEKNGENYYIRYSFENGTAKSALEFSTWTERIGMDGGLVHDGFIYFLVLYLPVTVDDQDTRLVRFCIQDGTFQSYSELPIACDHPTGQFKTNGYALHLDDSPSSETKSLYVIFTRDYEDPMGSILCIFPMTDVIRAFNTFSRKCLNAVRHVCHQEMIKEVKDFCGTDVRPYAVNQPLVVPYFKFLPDSIVSVIITMKYHKELVAIVVDHFFDVFKISLTTGQIISKNRIMGIDSTILSRVVFDRDHQHIYILGESQIAKYPVTSCRVHETCESCFTEGKSDPLNCGWCGEYCAHSKECEVPDSFSRDTCSPVIDEVSPQKGPIQGAIELKITGDNFGSYVDKDHDLITVAGIPCEVLDWQNREVTCILGPAPDEISGPVELSVTISNSTPVGYNVAGSTASHLNFSYYAGPRLFGMRPNKGPTSGGTYVLLFGENLDFENSKDRYFIVRGRLCNLRGFNTTTAWCITSNETKSDYPDKIAIVVDETIYVMDETPPPTFNHTDLFQSFEYIPDPEIHEIHPGFTTVSGLMNATVTGLYLDSVPSPQIVVKVSLSKFTDLEFLEECWSDPKSRGTKLTCSTPSLVDQLWLSKPTNTAPLLTHVSFIMDGVQWVREFSQHEEFISRLLYYPDPVFKTLGEVEKFEEDQTSMEIKGNNLGYIHSINNFHIKLGEKDSCKINIVSTELLICDLPPSLQNASSIGTNISVEVFMGSISHHLGYITIIPVKQNQVVLEKVLLAIYVIIPIIIIVVAFLCFRKIREKKLLHNTFRDIILSNRTETSQADNPPMSPRASLSDDPIENTCDELLSLDSERMFILEELGLIIQKQHLVIGELIGSGQFGKVFKGSLQIPNQKEMEIAIKTMYRHLWRNPVKADLFMKEALTMKDFDHPHVLGILGVCFEGNVPHIILPFMENGDLCNYIRDKTKTLLVSDLLKFAVDVASGMCYLAKLKFVHRDLAARNCVLDSSLRAKVADFGLSRDIYEGNYYRSQDKHAELPFRWTAPEVIETQVSTGQSDVWSYGVLLWELMTRGSIPYANIGNWDVLPYLKLGNRLNQPQFCPKPLYLSMLTCWNTDPGKRPSFFKLHSYVSEVHDKVLNNTVTEASSSSTEVAENTMYLNFTVPAQNTIYYDSKELYIKMDGHTLNTEDLEESYVIMNA